MPRTTNQSPEQVARDRIDERLRASGWQVQDKGASLKADRPRALVQGGSSAKPQRPARRRARAATRQ